MVEPPAQQFKADTILHSLDVAEGFAQRVRAIHSRQVDLPAPAFDKPVSVTDRQRLLSLSSLEEIIVLDQIY